jgi:glucuronoarabinoxylan endo-1,4-beta-xylanase
VEVALSKKKVLPGLILVIAVGIWLVGRRNIQTATIDWTEAHQTIDGFGAAIADAGSDYPVDFTSSDYDFFFSNTGSNIGLSLARAQVIPSNADCAAWVPKGPGCVPSSNATIFRGELTMAQEVVARGVKVFATEWSPTGSFKSNGVYNKGGSLITSTSNYASIGTTLASFVKLLASNGVPIYAIGVQNEPDMSETYPSCIWTAQQFHDVIPYVASALAVAGVSTTLIMFPENSRWSSTYGIYAATAMGDSRVAADVGIMAQHGYGSTGIVAPSSNYGKHLWMTEASYPGNNGGNYDGSMTDGLNAAKVIHDYLSVAQVNAIVWWFISNRPGEGNGPDNSALTDSSGNIPKRTYVTGQWSKFVRPGWSRVGVSYSGPLRISAFKDPGSLSFAIVAVNPGRKSVPQTFSLRGFSTNSITPWITSASLSLAAQTPVSVTSTSFTYTLPESSVTTFTGTLQKVTSSTK